MSQETRSKMTNKGQELLLPDLSLEYQDIPLKEVLATNSNSGNAHQVVRKSQIRLWVWMMRVLKLEVVETVFARDTSLQRTIWPSIMAVTIKHQLIITWLVAKRRETFKSSSRLQKPEYSQFLTCTKLFKLICLEQLQLVDATDLQVATIDHESLTSSIKETTTLTGSTRLVIKLNTSKVNISNRRLSSSFRAPSTNSALI